MLNGVDIFFTLLNFGIFVAICVYLYKKYGRSVLLEAMAAQENARKVLELEGVALKEERARLEAQLIADKEQARMLQEKSARWQRAQEAVQVLQQEEQRVITAALEAKAAAQAEWYTQHKIGEQLLPQVLTQARTQLDNKFASSPERAAYTADILTFMKKGAS